MLYFHFWFNSISRVWVHLIIEDKNKNYSQTKQQTDIKQTAVNEKLVENKTENQVNNGVEKKED